MQRLVKSIEAAIKPGRLHLYISLDGGASPDVVEYANSLPWEFGEKQIIEQKVNLGVDQHTLTVFEMLSEIGDALILEDDVRLSPNAFQYIAACSNLLEEDNIQGLSLYRYTFREEDHFPFELIPNDEFIYYQQRSSSNACYYRALDLASYIEFTKRSIRFEDYHIPDNVMSWDNAVWEKSYYCYLIETNAYLAFPRYSLATDYGEYGVHMKKEIHRFIHHSPLYLSDCFTSKLPENTMNCYDAFYEIQPQKLYSVIEEEYHDLTVDIYASKQLDKLNSKYILSSRTTNHAIRSWGRVLKPEWNNLLFDEAGDHYHLSLIEDVSQTAEKNKLKENFLYYYPDARIIDLLKMKWAEIRSRF